MNPKICVTAVLGVSKERPSCKIEDVGGACTSLDCDWPWPRSGLLDWLDGFWVWVEGKNKLACPVVSSTWILSASFCRRTCLSWSDNFATFSCGFSNKVLYQSGSWEECEIGGRGRGKTRGRRKMTDLCCFCFFLKTVYGCSCMELACSIWYLFLLISISDTSLRHDFHECWHMGAIGRRNEKALRWNRRKKTYPQRNITQFQIPINLRQFLHFYLSTFSPLYP